MGETRGRVRRSGLGPARADVLRYLQGAGRAETATTIAAAARMHPNTARFHLDALIRDGLVVREYEKRTERGRPKTLFRAEPAEPEASAASYRGLAGALMRHLASLTDDTEDEAEAAGFAWGEELAGDRSDGPGIDRVVGVLAEVGYGPTVVGQPAEAIEIRPCPFADLLDVEGNAICRLHLGLMRGLVADDQALTIAGLEPWATPTTCLARLGRVA